MALPSKERLASEYKEDQQIPIVEVKTPPEVGSKTEYIKEVNKEVSLEKPIFDKTGQKIVEDVDKKEIEVALPLSEQEMNRALKLKLKVNDSLKWLITWIERLLKKTSGNIIYHWRESPEQGV